VRARVLGAARQRDAQHEAIVAEKVAARGEERAAAAGEVMPDAASGHCAVEVGVPSGAPEGFELGHFVVGHAQRSVAASASADGGACQEIELDAGALG